MEYKQASRHDSDNGIWDLVKWKNVIKCQNLLRTETHSSGFCITFAAALSLLLSIMNDFLIIESHAATVDAFVLNTLALREDHI